MLVTAGADFGSRSGLVFIRLIDLTKTGHGGSVLSDPEAGPRHALASRTKIDVFASRGALHRFQNSLSSEQILRD